MEDLHLAFKGWAELNLQNAESMVLGAGFREAGREVFDDQCGPELLHRTMVRYALPDCDSWLKHGFSVYKYPVSISYHAGVVCKDKEREPSDPQAKFENSHRRNFECSGEQISDFFQIIASFAEGFTQKLGLQNLSDLTVVYNDLEHKGLRLQPVKIGKPFVFEAANGGQAVIRRNEEQKLVLETRWPGVERPCSSKEITELARYHRNRAAVRSTSMRLPDLILA